MTVVASRRYPGHVADDQYLAPVAEGIRPRRYPRPVADAAWVK